MAKPTILQVIKSVLSAFIGVQSQENRELDFTEGKPSHYIAVGVALTVVFVFIIILIVSTVI